jgi:hypothetical protein
MDQESENEEEESEELEYSLPFPSEVLPLPPAIAGPIYIFNNKFVHLYIK